MDSENVDGARAMDSVATRLVAQHKMLESITGRLSCGSEVVDGDEMVDLAGQLESVCHTMGTMLSVVRSWRVMVGPGSGCDK